MPERATFALPFTGVLDETFRAEALEEIAVAQARAGLGEESVNTSESILADREDHLAAIAEALMEAGDKERLKALLVPAAYHIELAWLISGFLARLYPEQAAIVAGVLRDRAEADQMTDAVHAGSLNPGSL